MAKSLILNFTTTVYTVLIINDLFPIAGHPHPSLSWTREDGQQLEENVELLSGGVIRIMSIQENNLGNYICTASNVAGTVTAVATIGIRDVNYDNDGDDGDRTLALQSTSGERSYNVDNTEDASQSVSVITEAGEDVNLNCIQSPERDYLHGDVVWSRTDNKRIDSRHLVVGGLLRIIDPRDDDEGEFLCEVEMI